MQQETEYKFLISLDQYKMLYDFFLTSFPAEKVLQINYYYDSEDYHFYKNDITFRIRQKNDKLRYEIKTLVERQANLNVKNEFTFDAEVLPLKISMSNFLYKDVLKYDIDIFLVGSLVTERILFNKDNGMEICLDKNLYLGVVDYELEIEFTPDSKEIVVDILNKIKILNTFDKLSGKNTRFFQKYFQLKKIAKMNCFKFF